MEWFIILPIREQPYSGPVGSLKGLKMQVIWKYGQDFLSPYYIEIGYYPKTGKISLQEETVSAITTYFGYFETIDSAKLYAYKLIYQRIHNSL